MQISVDRFTCRWNLIINAENRLINSVVWAVDEEYYVRDLVLAGGALLMELYAGCMHKAEGSSINPTGLSLILKCWVLVPDIWIWNSQPQTSRITTR